MRSPGSMPEVQVLHRTVREGLGPAYLAGFDRALSDGAGYVLEMDADFSHDPADLARLLATVRSGTADLALGSRYAAGGGVERLDPAAACDLARRRRCMRRWCWPAGA